MASDADIDRLYQLPLPEFTAARNALAKRAGGDAASIKALTKPPLAAWAVNQLYWHDRAAYDALIEAAEAQRATHKAVLGGKRGDLRAAGKDHEEAVERALKSTLARLADSGTPATEATRQAISQTLRALPAPDPPGRLSRALQPGGFEMLAGVTVRPGSRATPPSTAPAARKKDAKENTAAEKARLKEQDAREELTVASRELRAAEHAAKRAEFESARAVRAAAKAEEELADARAALEAARERVARADAEVTKTKRQIDAAQRAAAAADRELSTAKKRADAAEEKLARLKPRG